MSLPEKGVVVVAGVIAVGLTLVIVGTQLGMLGMMLVFPPYYGFKYLRRAWRIVKAAGDDYDEDGCRRYWDQENRAAYYVVPARSYRPTRAYVIVEGRKICAYVSRDQEVVYCGRDGKPIRRLPKDLKESPLRPSDLPREAREGYRDPAAAS